MPSPLWLATHEAARAVIPDAMVAYVDYDPAAVLHSQALLGRGRREVVAVGADMRAPKAILAHDDIRAVEASTWQPGQPDIALEERSSMIVAGVGCKR